MTDANPSPPTVVLVHGAFADAGISVSPQVGENDAVPGGELLRDRFPDTVMGRERVEQDEVGTTAQNFVKNLGVRTADLHSGNCSRRRVRICYGLA